MRIIDLLTAPWAIQPEKLLEIQEIYATHLRGDKIDVKGIEAALGRPLDNNQTAYDVIDGVAVISIDGVIAKRMNLFSQISGGASSELIARDVQAALADSAVHSIILAIDSPGGAVDGTQILAQQIVQARDIKPIVTLANGTMASAAYWIGSAASQAYITDATTKVGSIGVVAAHRDFSQQEAKLGVKTTEITAGKFKRIASAYEPLTQEGRQTIQDAVDAIYSVFVSDVAAQRGVSVDQVLADMADGRVFIGQDAIDRGLVDGVSTLDALIAQLNQDRAGAATVTANQSQTEQEINMPLTREQIEKDSPHTIADIQKEAREAGYAEGLAAGKIAGATAERERIQSVEDQAVPGHEALIQSLKFDGKTTGPEAAVQILAAEKKTRQGVAKEIREDQPEKVPNIAAPQHESAAQGGEDESDMDEAALKDKAKGEWDKDAQLRSEFAGSFEAYFHYRKADARGQVKVLGQRTSA